MVNNYGKKVQKKSMGTRYGEKVQDKIREKERGKVT
jgi:hypothetical protein